MSSRGIIEDELSRLMPWHCIQVVKETREEMEKKALDDLPEYITAIADGTLGYEMAIRSAWEPFKKHPSVTTAGGFIETLKKESSDRYKDVLLAVLDLEELYPVHVEFLEEYIQEHHRFLEEKLQPDIMTAMSVGKPVDVNARLNALDYRVILMYAGALWAFGMLSIVTFDGIQARDLLALFMFAGPNDDRTCTGPRGCEQHVGKVYTVAQILMEDIIPGHMKCGGNCRHMLLPIFFWPEFRTQEVACKSRECIRYRGAVDSPFSGVAHVCDAYPFGIPEEILSGEDKHMLPRGDEIKPGITYLGPELWSPSV